MFFVPRPLSRHATVCLILAVFVLSLPAWAAEKAHFHADDYQIDAVLNPHDHKIIARAKVKITALEDLNIATFQLHNDLRLTKVADGSGKSLTADRIPQSSSVRVSLTKPVPKNESTTFTFDYEGVLDSADDSPVPGLKLTSINEDTSYLLYAGDWFPVNEYGIDRFTATINVTVPAHMIVIGSGRSVSWSGADEDILFEVRQGKFSWNHCCGRIRRLLQHRGWNRFACVFQAHAQGVGLSLRGDRSQGIHLLHNFVRAAGFERSARSRIAG